MKIVLLRHGESCWNQENRFTGWTDVDLSENGRAEALQAGKLLDEAGYTFDLVYTSVLKRAIRTAWIVLDEMNLMWLPVIRDWHLNERHYGALQGLNKLETAEEYGKNQVLQWRRSYDVRPPLLTKDDDRYPGYDKRYSNLSDIEIPLGECLKDTIDRFLPYWHDHIVLNIKRHKQVLLVAHGNTLRALIKHLDKLTNEEVVQLNIPTGIPLVYELDENFRAVKHYYLGGSVNLKYAVGRTKIE